MSSTAESVVDEVVAIEVTDILDAAPKTAIARFDPLRAGLAALKEKFTDYVPDLSTKAGEDVARAHRKELVTIRTSATKIYEQLNAPLLDAQRQARAMRDEIAATAEKFELPIDAAIKAKELEREAEKKRKADAEAARVKAIRDRITNIASLPTLAVDLCSADIQAVINDLGNSAFSEERFGEFLDEAEELATTIGHKLSAMRDGAAAREAEALRLAAERAELERLRSEQIERDRAAAEQRAADEAAAAAKLKKEQDELAAARAAFQAEQDAAAARAREAEDAARRKRDDVDAAQRAFLKKQQDAFEEERRAELERQERENAALAEQRAELQRQQDELAARSVPDPVKLTIEESAAQVDPQESFIPAEAPAPTPAPAPVAAAPAAEAAVIDTFFGASDDLAVTDLKILQAVADAFGWDLRSAFESIRAMDLDALAEAVADSEVPA